MRTVIDNIGVIIFTILFLAVMCSSAFPMEIHGYKPTCQGLAGSITGINDMISKVHRYVEYRPSKEAPVDPSVTFNRGWGACGAFASIYYEILRLKDYEPEFVWIDTSAGHFICVWKKYGTWHSLSTESKKSVNQKYETIHTIHEGAKSVADVVDDFLPKAGYSASRDIRYNNIYTA